MQKKSSNLARGLSSLKKSGMRNSQTWTTAMVQKIIFLEDNQGIEYLTKNSIEELLVKIDKNHIEVIDKFAKYRKNGFNLLEFVRFFLNILHHDQIQNLYLTIGVIDFFKAVSTFAGEERVTFSNITNFLCQKILQKQESKNQIESKNIPEITYVNPNYQIKDFIRNPPTIYGSNDETLYKLSPNSIMTDKSKHNRAVNSSSFSHDLKMIFTLDALSQYISVYDFNCCQINKIYPSFSKIKKDVVVLGFAFSQRQCRVGAVLKNFSIVFWDCSPSNSFDYEKTWTTTSFCQHLQSSIFYLEYFNCWITSDKTGTLYFWDLLNSKPSREFKCKYYSSVNVLCEINALNIIAIVQESKQLVSESAMVPASQHSHSEKKNTFYECNITLYNFFTGEIMNEISCADDRVPHTIQYSEQFQILFTAGLEKKIKLWEISPIYMDSSLKGELIGHENLITSFTLIRKTSFLVSCDDKGKIKLWDFKNFACIQTIDFSDKAMITNLLDMVEIGKIGVLGSRIHYIDFEDKHEVIKKIKNKQKLSIEWIDFDECRNQIYIFTQKDLRVLDMVKGCVKYIYGCFNSNDDDYTCFRYFSCILKFAIGNDKGEVSLYDISTGSYLYQLKTSHEASVVGVEYDQLNKLFVTFGLDSSILIHKESTKELVREIKGNFYGKEISCFQLSVFHNLIAISTHEKEFNSSVFIWNYEFGKLSGQIIINEGQQVVSLQFINGYNILAIASNTGIMNLVKVKQLPGAQIKLEQLSSLQMSKPITSVICDIVLKGGKKSQLQECVLLVSFQDGSFQQVDISEYIKKFQEVPHVKQKSNYNPYRESKETFAAQYMKKKHCKLVLSNTQKLPKRNSQKQKSYTSNNCKSIKEVEKQKSTTKLQTKVAIQFDEAEYEDFTDEENEQQQLNEQRQNIYPVSIKKLEENLLNPMTATQSREQIPVDSLPRQSGFTQLNILKLMNYEKRFVLMVGNNRRLKIFSPEYKLICDLNINYPLPYLWKFKPKVHRKIQDKIYFAIKVLNSILSKYESDISVGEAKNYKLRDLFDTLNGRKSLCMTYNNKDRFSSLNERNSLTNERDSLMLTEPYLNFSQIKKKKSEEEESIPLIQEEYSKNDLNYQLVKEYNFHQVAGPTLKELDHIKKIELLQKEWRHKEKQEQEDCDKLLKMIQTRVRKNEEKDQLASFLSPSNKIKDQKDSGYIFNLKKKIQNIKTVAQKQTEEKEKQKERSIPFLNGSKLIGFALTKAPQAKKDFEEKPLMQSCMKRFKTVKSMKRLNTTSTFEDHYESLKESSKSKMFKRASPLTSELTNTIYDTINSRYSLSKGQTIGTSESNLRKDKISNSSFGQVLRQSSSGNKFRRILTEMNEKVRQKKLQKIRFL